MAMQISSPISNLTSRQEEKFTSLDVFRSHRSYFLSECLNIVHQTWSKLFFINKQEISSCSFEKAKYFLFFPSIYFPCRLFNFLSANWFICSLTRLTFLPLYLLYYLFSSNSHNVKFRIPKHKRVYWGSNLRHPNRKMALLSIKKELWWFMAEKWKMFFHFHSHSVSLPSSTRVVAGWNMRKLCNFLYFVLEKLENSISINLKLRGKKFLYIFHFFFQLVSIVCF